MTAPARQPKRLVRLPKRPRRPKREYVVVFEDPREDDPQALDSVLAWMAEPPPK